MTPAAQRLNGYLPAVNLVTIIAAVAVMWWRLANLEQQVGPLRAAVVALQVDVAVLSQAIKDRP